MERIGQDGTRKFGEKDMGVLRVLLVFTCVMLIAPILAYFFMKSFIFEGFLGYQNGSVNAAVGTVVIVHIIIAWYIWTAIKEERAEQTLIKKD